MKCKSRRLLSFLTIAIIAATSITLAAPSAFAEVYAASPETVANGYTGACGEIDEAPPGYRDYNRCRVRYSVNSNTTSFKGTSDYTEVAPGIAYNFSEGCWDNYSYCEIDGTTYVTGVGHSSLFFRNQNSVPATVYCYDDKTLALYRTITLPADIISYNITYSVPTRFYVNQQMKKPQYVKGTSSFSKTYNQQSFSLGITVSETE